MISIHGKVARSFLFPVNLSSAFDFYCDFDRILHFLPHISIVNKYPNQGYRMLYHTTELGVYRVNIYCDIAVETEQQPLCIKIKPSHLSGVPVKGEVGLYSLIGQGYYSSTSTFTPEGDQTRIEYQFSLNAELPIPLGLRLVPNNILDGIASNLTKWRIKEIAEGFITRSLEAHANL
jgi:hypothetical protein